MTHPPCDPAGLSLVMPRRGLFAACAAVQMPWTQKNGHVKPRKGIFSLPSRQWGIKMGFGASVGP